MLYWQNGATNLRRIFLEWVHEANTFIMIICTSIDIFFTEPVYRNQILELALLYML